MDKEKLNTVLSNSYDVIMPSNRDIDSRGSLYGKRIIKNDSGLKLQTIEEFIEGNKKSELDRVFASGHPGGSSGKNYHALARNGSHNGTLSGRGSEDKERPFAERFPNEVSILSHRKLLEEMNDLMGERDEDTEDDLQHD